MKEVLELVEALEQKAKDENLSRTALAAKIGISENYLYRWKNGDRKPGRKTLNRIAGIWKDLKPVTEAVAIGLLGES